MWIPRSPVLHAKRNGAAQRRLRGRKRDGGTNVRRIEIREEEIQLVWKSPTLLSSTRLAAEDRHSTGGGARQEGLEEDGALARRHDKFRKEPKEHKKARRVLARQHKRTAGKTNRTLYGAPFVSDPTILGGSSQQGKAESRSAFWSASVFRVACGRDHDPVVSKLTARAETHPRVLAARPFRRCRTDWSEKAGGKNDARRTVPPSPLPIAIKC